MPLPQAQPSEPLVNQKIHKHQCSCGPNPQFPQLCKEAFIWYTQYNNKYDQEYYQKLKQIYKVR
jgi:hypothetical protein